MAMTEAPDFDTRPGEPVRSTIDMWVARCAGCGYCSADLTHIHEGGPALVYDERYRVLLNDQALPESARWFLCYALILENAGQFSDAGWSALHAGWVCDDARDNAAAARCRMRAIELWKNGKQAGQAFADDVGSEFALAADVFRRAGEFEHAIVACSEALDMEETPAHLKAVLLREKMFIERRDRSCHSLSELQNTSATGPRVRLQ